PGLAQAIALRRQRLDVRPERGDLRLAFAARAFEDALLLAQHRHLTLDLREAGGGLSGPPRRRLQPALEPILLGGLHPLPRLEALDLGVRAPRLVLQRLDHRLRGPEGSPRRLGLCPGSRARLLGRRRPSQRFPHVRPTLGARALHGVLHFVPELLLARARGAQVAHHPLVLALALAHEIALAPERGFRLLPAART